MKSMLPVFALLMITWFSCQCDDTSSLPECQVSNPIQELPWLNAYVNSLNCSCQITVYSGRYHFATVFFARMNDPLCNGNGQFTIYDCSGRPVKTYSTETSGEFTKEVTGVETLLVCKE